MLDDILDGVKKKVIATAAPIGSIFFPIDQSYDYLNLNLETPVVSNKL